MTTATPPPLPLPPPPSIALLGDSIFDNRAYTNGEPDVADHLGELLPPDGRVTLCAVDGATTADFGEQLGRVPPHTTHVVLSLGGNDALLNADILDLPVRSTAEALRLFGQRLTRFEPAYSRALDTVVGLGHPTTVCTIYNGSFPAEEAEKTRVALMMFNDVILRQAFTRGLDVVDLRLVCTEPSDYANPIEPSGPGGAKIARALLRSLIAGGPPARRSCVGS